MNVDDVVRQKIEAAERKAAARKRDRAAFAAARSHGLARRHAARMRNLADAEQRRIEAERQDQDAEPEEPDGDWAIARLICLDCGQSTSYLGEYYMVHDEVWNAAAEPFDGMLCVGCLEARIGRTLTAVDFTDADVNKPGDGRKSARLIDRLGRAA